MAMTTIWTVDDNSQPKGIVVDSQGDILIACDTDPGYGPTVRKLRPDGSLVWLNNDIPRARYIGVDSADNVYVAYPGTSASLRKFNSSGVPQWTVNFEAGAGLQAFCVDPAGNASIALVLPKLPGASYILKSSSLVIRTFNNAGVLINTTTVMAYTDYSGTNPGWVDTGCTLWGMAADANGNIAYSYRLWWKSQNYEPIVWTYEYSSAKMTVSHVPIWFKAHTIENKHYDLAFDSLGNTYANTYPAIITKYSPSGALIWQRSYAVGDNNDISVLKVDKFDNLLFGYYWPGALHKINSNGDVLWFLEFVAMNTDIYGADSDPTGAFAYSTHWTGPITKTGLVYQARTFHDGFVLGYQCGVPETPASEALTTASFGPKGPDGIIGNTGADGSKGLTGLSGSTGLQGASGGPGLPGLAGSNGVDGLQGTQGTQGAQGTPGAQGIQGTPGTNGTNGIIGPAVPIFNDIQLYANGVKVTRSNLSVISYPLAKDFQGRLTILGDTIVEYIDGLMP